jgi:putative peptide zinc metalloprotease protein
MATFSDSWHRIAQLKVELRPQVRVHRQMIRGERWFVLQDPLANQFFRVRRQAWAVLSRCDGTHTLETLWRDALERDPEGAPGQQELLQLLAQLHAGNLITTDVPADTQRIFERQRKRQRREMTGKLLGIMFARLPIFNPDAILKRLLPLFGWLFSRTGFVLWLLVVGFGLKTVIDNFGALADQTQGVLAPGNLPLLYFCLVGLALIHESGHAFACRKFGGQVPVIGIMLLIFTPLPYVDVTSSWSFRERRRRLIVGAAGMMFELAVAAAAAVVWSVTAPGLVNALAFNVMFLASVSTLLFNINPLLRFDGYYLMSDMMRLPNLYTRAQSQVKHLWERHVLGLPRSLPVAQDRREAFWLTFYGIASALYRVFLCASIIFFVAGRFLILGLLMAVFCIVAWVFVPIGKGIHYLVTNPALDRRRGRAWGGTAAAVGIPLLFLALVPIPRTFTVPGVVEADPHSLVLAEAPGTVVEILAPAGSFVTAGQPLVRMENESLLAERRATSARLLEARSRARAALREGATFYATALRYQEAVERQARYLDQQIDALVVRARHDGIWTAPMLEQRPGMHLPRGSVIGEVLGGDTMRFTAVVPQGRGAVLFDDSEPLREVRLRLRGQSDVTLRRLEPEILPGERLLLPSPSLGWRGGGPVPVRDDDERGVVAKDPFFAVQVALPEDPRVTPFHGQTGRLLLVRAPAPALTQLWEAFRQLLQRRFQL